MKTKNLNDFLKKNRKKVKVVEDSRARESICCKITEGCTFTDDEMMSSDILSSDVLSSEVVNEVVGEVVNEVVGEVLSNVVNKVVNEGGSKVIKEEMNVLVNDKDKELCNLVKDVNVVVNKTVLPSTTIDNRINKIKQFTNLNLHIDHSKLEPYLILPKNLLRISKIFKALITIQNYNSVRKLTSIFIKIKGSIERTLKLRVEEEDIKKIYFLINDKIELKPLSIEEKGEMVKTFTYKINCTGEEMDRRLLEFYKENGEEEVPQKEFVNEEDNEISKVEEGVSKEADNKDEDDNKDEAVKTFNNDSKNVEINNDTVMIKNQLDTQSNTYLELNSTRHSSNIQLSALTKTNSILERIKQKELKRKEEFVKKMQKKNEEKALIKRVIFLFKKESKKALKINNIVKILDIYEGDRQIKKIVEDNPKIFEIRKILDERKLMEDEYLIYLE